MFFNVTTTFTNEITGPIKFYAVEKPFYPEYSMYSLTGRSCPVKVNTIEEPIFLSKKFLIKGPVKFYAVEKPFYPEYSTVFFTGRCCPVNVNTLEEPNF